MPINRLLRQIQEVQWHVKHYYVGSIQNSAPFLLLTFIPIAEDTGLIQALGKWVLETACMQIKNWQEAGFSELGVSVNVSANQFQNKYFMEEVQNALANSRLDAKYLHLELTESVMLNQTIETISTMRIIGSTWCENFN